MHSILHTTGACRFPQCLHLLELAQKPAFQRAIARKDLQIAVAWQQDYFFRHYRANRMREQAGEAEAAEAIKAAPHPDGMGASVAAERPGGASVTDDQGAACERATADGGHEHTGAS